MDPTLVEVMETIERLQASLDRLLVRGLRAAGQEQLSALEQHRESLQRAGAEHLASSLQELVEQTQEGDRQAARTMLRLQTSVRLFERVLSQRAVGDHLAEAEEEYEADIEA